LARIRTIKPEFYRDEDLQDLERGNPGQHTMLVFSGLWGHCDKNGNFEWRPRTLKLDVLPFLDFEMADTLELLQVAGFIEKYTVDGKDYGHIPTFDSHQRISGKEAQEGAKFPDVSQRTDGEAAEKHLERQEGKGREGKGIGESPRGDASPGNNIPYQSIVDLFNATLTKLPRVRELTNKRRTAIRSAWQGSEDRRKPEFWLAYFEECAQDNFLNGTGPYKNGHENWQPTFDFLMRSDQITKTYEKAMHRLEARR
jgi:hypothetical protein